MIDQKELLVARDIFSPNLKFLLKQGNAIGTMVTMETNRDKQHIEPTFTLPEEAAQKLFNQLWNEGFRPKDGTGNSGHIAAMQAHLEDMRLLVFKPKGGAK